MGGTGLEPVTPSLSSKYADSDDVRLSPIFPAHDGCSLALKHQHLNAAGTVCAFFVRRGDGSTSTRTPTTLDQPNRLTLAESP
jgi:hypothetical protein